MCLYGEISRDCDINDFLNDYSSNELFKFINVVGELDLVVHYRITFLFIVGDFLNDSEATLLSMMSPSSGLCSRLRFTFRGRRVRWSKFIDAFNTSFWSIL